MMNHSNDRVLIVGPSGRAAAQMLRRRGIASTVIDLFADRDTTAAAEATIQIRMNDYPDGVVTAAIELPPMSWMYTGGLENAPDIIDATSQHHRLIGNSSEDIRILRNPFQLKHTLAELNIPMPAMSREPPDPCQKWLLKPYRSAGGRSIHLCNQTTVQSSSQYYQEMMSGIPVSAIFDGDHCLGTTRQLMACEWLHAPSPYQYCGNILDHRPDPSLVRIAAQIQSHFHLKHYWGVDAIRTSHGHVVLEINPRYCASHELADRVRSNIAIGKAIYYSPTTIAFPDDGPWMESLNHPDSAEYADIPWPGTAINPGDPVMTFFAMADTPGEVEHRLRAMATGCDKLLKGSS
jgi:uncharacterized protein